MADNAKFIPSTDLGVSLSKDDNGTKRDELQGHIREAKGVAEKRLAAGVTPQEGEKLKNFLEASESAQKIVDIVWNVTHIRS